MTFLKRVLNHFVFQMIAMFALLTVSFMVLAQATAAVVAPPTFLDAILKLIQDTSPAVIAGVVAVLEIVMRVFPSAKALSLLVPVKYVLVGLATIFGWLAGILTTLITAANNTTAPK